MPAGAPAPRLDAVPPLAAFRGLVRDDVLARAVYAEGAGIGRVIPDGVAIPRDAADVAALTDWASTNGLALTPRGSGSGMAGAAVGSGVVVDCSPLDQIGPVDVERRTIRCGPGAIRQQIDAAARLHGLRFPVDPSSGPFCTIGGMAATNAAGARTLRFGATREWIQAIDCVLADGSAVRIRRGEAPPAGSALARITSDLLPRWRGHDGLQRDVRKESSGYAVARAAESGDIVDLLIGSEGTLAVFTELELRLTPVAQATASALAVFRSLEDATAAAVRTHALDATACELLDRTFLDIAAAASPLPGVAGSEAVLLIEVEGGSHAEAASVIALIRDACLVAGATHVELALEPRTEGALWSLRHAASPTLARLDPHLKSMQFIEDACIPVESLPAYVHGVREVLEARRIRCAIFGHAGDANVHVNPLIDLRRTGWRAAVAAVLDEVTDLVAGLGGTLTGEHGDGRLRTPLLDRVWSAHALDCFGEVKRAFDPHGVLNPGVKVGRSGDSALGDIKYDPDLPPLPAAARAALDRVERERAYAAPRLSLLDR
jgi:FAD/FMN-containing dehydrogenase